MLAKSHFSAWRLPIGITWLIGMLSVSLPGWGAEAAGTVIFVHGDAWVTPPGQPEKPLRKGDDLPVGASIRTGTPGHVHIRWADQGFTGMKPKSQLYIVAFQRESKQLPAQVKFELRDGVARFITGEIGQANKAAFRLNTPLAAIGIRGTDFTIEVGEHATVAAINRGEIVMSPFSDACLAADFGPCHGGSAMSLSALQSDQVLELNTTGKLFLRKKTEQDAGLRLDLSSVSKPETLKSEGQPVELSWRHWQGRPDEALIEQGYQVAASNDVFSLYRKTEPIDLPTLGVVSFSPVYSEAYAVNALGARESAVLSNMNLTVNFDQQRFKTAFVWQYAGNALSYAAEGDLLPKGIMQIDPNTPGFNSFYGLLSSRAKETAYIFEAGTGSDLRALGLIRWQSQAR